MTTLENKFLKLPLAHIMGWKRLIQTCLMSNSIKKGKKKRKKRYKSTFYDRPQTEWPLVIEIN